MDVRRGSKKGEGLAARMLALVTFCVKEVKER